MTGKVAKGKRADVTYLVSSAYFILNSASLLIYPACRFFGMQNLAQAFFSESVSDFEMQLNGNLTFLEITCVDFWSRSRVSGHRSTLNVPASQAIHVTHLGALLLVPFPLRQASMSDAFRDVEHERSCLLRRPLLHTLAHCEPSEIQRAIKAQETQIYERACNRAWAGQ